MIFIKQVTKFISLTLMALLVGCTSTKPTGHEEQPTARNQKLADYNVQLGVGYMQQNDLPLAKQKLLIALEKAPNWPPALEAMAYFYEVTGELNKAKDYYQRALSAAPRQGSTLNNYGTFLCKQGHYRESLTYFDKAVEDINYLKTAETYENAGLCAAKIPDYSLAQKYLEKAYQQNPSRIIPLLDLADIAYQQGKYQAALGYLNTYANDAELDPRHANMRAILIRKLKS